MRDGALSETGGELPRRGIVITHRKELRCRLCPASVPRHACDVGVFRAKLRAGLRASGTEGLIGLASDTVRHAG